MPDTQLIGTNVQVNSITTGNQYAGFVSALADGKFLATWFDPGTGLKYSQLLSASGEKIDGQYAIASSRSNGGQFALSDGRIVIYGVLGSDEGRILKLDGSVDGPPFGGIPGVGYNRFAPLTGGGFVLTDSSTNYRDIIIQAYDGLGHKVGPQTSIASGTYNEFVVKDVVGLADGGFLLMYKPPSGGLVG